MASTSSDAWLERSLTQMREMSPHMATVAASLSQPTIQILLEARKEAIRRNQISVNTEHLLLGMLQLNNNNGALALRNLGIDTLALRNLVEKVVNEGTNKLQMGEGGLSQLALSALVVAWDEMAEQTISTHLEPGHLLLGLWREGGGVAAHLLIQQGFSLEQARAQVVSLTNSQADSEAGH